MTEEALTLYLEMLREMGEPIPVLHVRAAVVQSHRDQPKSDVLGVGFWRTVDCEYDERTMALPLGHLLDMPATRRGGWRRGSDLEPQWSASGHFRDLNFRTDSIDADLVETLDGAEGLGSSRRAVPG
jgi:hypothetical protein